MRKLALAALLAIGATQIAGVSPAAAIDFPYCLQSRETGYPGDCSYRSYAECSRSVSGRAGVCGINPRVAFAQQRHGRADNGYYGDRYDGVGAGARRW